ncbi:AAEL011335-PA [Aedes aegypti]|uniref:AAEL011335-PA n=1 Tax=Aedes aegypti TaxID=7159 RepID=Q16QC2_AEDAE|nr:AAEL011335-PA [Aedes aegypti]
MDLSRVVTCVLLSIFAANLSRADDFVCPTDDEILAYPNPESCKKYYRCTFGVLEELTCPYTLYFDAISRGCTFAATARCVEGTEVEKWDRPICADDGQDVKLVPHQSICAKYYLCLGTNAVEKHCEDGLLFDEVLRQCTLKARARCHVDPWCPEYDQLQDIKFFNDPEDCSRYAVCYNRQLHYQYCAEGLFFSVEKQECTKPELSDCKVRDVECGWITLIPHPNKCTNYYDCFNGYPALRACVDGFYFDDEVGTCLPNNGQCVPHEGSTTTIQTTLADGTTATSSVVSSTTVAPTTPENGDGKVDFRNFDA